MNIFKNKTAKLGATPAYISKLQITENYIWTEFYKGAEKINK